MNEQHNPWQVINEQEIYSNNWISLKHYDVINPRWEWYLWQSAF